MKIWLQNFKNYDKYELVSHGIAALFTLFIFVFLVLHKSPDALPGNLPNPKYTCKNSDCVFTIIAHTNAADSIRDYASIMITLGVALFAIIGFALKDGFGRRKWVSVITPVALAIFLYFITRVILYGVEIHIITAIQMEQKTFYIDILSPLWELQAKSFAFASVTALGFLYIRYRW